MVVRTLLQLASGVGAGAPLAANGGVEATGTRPPPSSTADSALLMCLAYCHHVSSCVTLPCSRSRVTSSIHTSTWSRVPPRSHAHRSAHTPPFARALVCTRRLAPSRSTAAAPPCAHALCMPYKHLCSHASHPACSRVTAQSKLLSIVSKYTPP